MSDIDVRITGRAGRITLTRPKALNAVTYEMVKAIHAALEAWRSNDAVALVVIDAEGEKAFSAGGDIADLYARGTQRDFAFGQHFWSDEYRMNYAIHAYEKPVISFLQGFTMGGGMGVGCHGSHRIVGESSQIAMPECGIGLVPDVGGSMILANAPAHLGAYLGCTGARMAAGDAILAGFADHFIPEAAWPSLIANLEDSGDASLVAAAASAAPKRTFEAVLPEINAAFGKATLAEVIAHLEGSETEFSKSALKALQRGSPLSLETTLEMMMRLKGKTDLRDALRLEYRFTARAMEHGDFLEGIRAAIIDKDRTPKWKHKLSEMTPAIAAPMLASLGDDELTFE